MATINTNLSCNLQQAVKAVYLDGIVFTQDNMANQINVSVYDGNIPAIITGTVIANIIRSDGVTVAATGGSISGNVASITLPEAAYYVPGVISVIVKLTTDGVVTTIAVVVANVYQSSTDTVADPGTILPSIAELIAAIDAAVASIPADYSDLWTSLAPSFNSNINYTVGRYVTYDGGVYRFINNHSGSWNAEDVVATNIGENLSSIKAEVDEHDSAIDGIEAELNNIAWLKRVVYSNSKNHRLPLPYQNVPAGTVIYFRAISTTDSNIIRLGLYGNNTNPSELNELAWSDFGNNTIQKIVTDKSYEYIYIYLYPYPSDTWTGTINCEILFNNESYGVAYEINAAQNDISENRRLIEKNTGLTGYEDIIVKNDVSSYYIDSTGSRVYGATWSYKLFDAKKDDIIVAITEGIKNTSSAIFSYSDNAFTSLVTSDKNGKSIYIYNVEEDGTYGVNSNSDDPTVFYFMHESAEKKNLIYFEESTGFNPALMQGDSINRFSYTADMLLTSKVDYEYHDNFDRANSYNNIGYNFAEGDYIDKYDNFFPVGIYNKMAYSTNPNDVVGKHFKLYDAVKYPYIATASAPDDYFAALTIGYQAIDKQIAIIVRGAFDDRYIRINYDGEKPDLNLYPQYRRFKRVSACVWPDHFDIYLDGRYYITIHDEVKSTLCGMMFGTSEDYRYDWFSVAYPSKFEEIGFDEVIEKYGLIGKGYMTETGNPQGIIISTDNTLDSKKSIRFKLNINDELAAGSKRSEIGLQPRKLHNLCNKLYTFDVYFDSDYLYDSLYEIIFQLHTLADDDNYAGLIPSLALVVQRNICSIATRGQSDKAVDNDHSTSVSQQLFEIETGRWYHFVIYQREAYTEGGNPLTVCFVDGECLFFSEVINAYNADHGTYPKWGIYKTPWKDQTSETTERTIFVDNIKMWY